LRSPYLALIVFAMIAGALLWAPNVEPISQVRTVFWDATWGVLLFRCVVRPLAGDVTQARTGVQHVRRLALHAT
jgi:hypothetical protein